MTQLNKFDAIYEKDPFSVKLDIRNMKNGLYQVQGFASDENWKTLCERIGVPVVGGCSADVLIHKESSHQIKVTGTIHVEMERECVRSLEPFLLKETLTLNEKLRLDAVSEDEEDDMLETEELDLGDYLAQMIIIYMTSYPISPSANKKPAGAFNVDDGIQEQVDEEKNPFSVLKNLKLDTK